MTYVHPKYEYSMPFPVWYVFSFSTNVLQIYSGLEHDGREQNLKALGPWPVIGLLFPEKGKHEGTGKQD